MILCNGLHRFVKHTKDFDSPDQYVILKTTQGTQTMNYMYQSGEENSSLLRAKTLGWGKEMYGHEA